MSYSPDRHSINKQLIAIAIQQPEIYISLEIEGRSTTMIRQQYKFINNAKHLQIPFLGLGWMTGFSIIIQRHTIRRTTTTMQKLQLQKKWQRHANTCIVYRYNKHKSSDLELSCVPFHLINYFGVCCKYTTQTRLYI